MYADVILPLRLPGTFTYEVPGGFAVSPGCRVLVPVGDTKRYAGVVLRVHEDRPDGDFTIKPIEQVLDIDGKPLVTPLMLQLWQWIADYYLCTLGDVMRAALPAKMRDGKKHRSLSPNPSPVGRGAVNGTELLAKVPTANITTGQQSPLPTGEGLGERLEGFGERLSFSQSRALAAIVSSPQPITLLHGVTASGKTEIYMQLMASCIKGSNEVKGLNNINSLNNIKSLNSLGGQVLYLVPEIALTTQLETRLRAVFGESVGCFHSKMSEAQRTAVWMRQLGDNPYPIILGARSSVFLPWRNLLLVIIDEEHEASYKQQEPAPRYHARNVALMLARMTGAKVVLGSATPSMESYFHARKKHYGLVELKEKYSLNSLSPSPSPVGRGAVNGTELLAKVPTVNITTGQQSPLPTGEGLGERLERLVVDIGELRRKKLMKGIISPPLREAMGKALAKGEQVILFQNRRGWAPLVECKNCGWVPRCTRCDVSLTMHRQRPMMVCHSCGASYAVPTVCPKCSSSDLRSRGVGTEKVEDEVMKLFPEARVARLDLDSAKSTADFATIIDDFAEGRTNVLIGTQMVTKGLDFSRVSVVGILAADTALNVPDFRAYERAYELMTQVSGRAGRKGMHSTTIIQTRQPELSVIRQVVNNDYLAHYKEVMQERMDFNYPPFCRLIDIYFRHRYENVAEDVARHFTADIIAACQPRPLSASESKSEATGFAGVEVLGPDAPATARAAGLYIRKAVIKIPPTASLTAFKQFLRKLYWDYTLSSRWRQPSIIFDVDPMN